MTIFSPSSTRNQAAFAFINFFEFFERRGHHGPVLLGASDAGGQRIDNAQTACAACKSSNTTSNMLNPSSMSAIRLNPKGR